MKSPSFSCHLSNLTLIDIVVVGSEYDITVQLCVGTGVTGFSQGASDNTFDILFSFSSANPSFELLNYPSTIQSNFSGVIFPGFDTGEIPQFFADESVYYSDFTNNFGCITSTALCGNVAADCETMTFRLTHLPDSLRVYGVESNGNGDPLAGCSPNPDMMIDFSVIPLAVDWDYFNVIAHDKSSAKLNWGTINQNSDYFEIQKIDASTSNWTKIGIVDVDNHLSGENHFMFEDRNLLNGTTFYRIKEVDINGITSFSEVVEFTLSGQDEVQIFPNPVSQKLFIENISEECQEVNILNVHGKLVKRFDAFPNNSVSFSVENYINGFYFVQLVYPSETKILKFLKN